MSNAITPKYVSMTYDSENVNMMWINDLLFTYHLHSWWTCHGQRRNWSTLVGCEGRSGWADGISNIVKDLYDMQNWKFLWVQHTISSRLNWNKKEKHAYDMIAINNLITAAPESLQLHEPIKFGDKWHMMCFANHKSVMKLSSDQCCCHVPEHLWLKEQTRRLLGGGGLRRRQT